MSRYDRDPYWTEARFDSDCGDSRCHRRIHKGERIFYYPKGRKALCESCGQVGYSDLMNEERGAW